MWIKPTRIENIDKFTLTDGTGVSYSQNGFCAFIVSDSGAGMSEGQLSQLFRDGVQFHVNELQGGNGTGLGLHISKGIVKQHRGTLAADSAGLLKGSTLTMTLPVYHVPASANPKIVEAPPISIENLLTLQSESELNPLRILIVDDSTMNRKLLQRHLKVHGHRCHVAENGQEALDRFIQSKKSDQRYDSILIDNEMPVMNGPTAVRRMRALGCDSYVVGITGNILPEDVAYFKRCGANAVLPKPFNYQDLQDLWVEYGMVNSKSTTDLGEFVED